MTVPNPNHHPREFLHHLFQSAVHRALPLHNTAKFLPNPPKGRTVVVGAGKAAASMAQAVEALWPLEAPLSGLVVTRYGHTPDIPAGLTNRIEIVEASHPVPDARGLHAAERILEAVKNLSSDDLVLCLMSGGGSSLLTLPAHGLSLQDKQAINQALLKSGANISEMNCVRKHLSRIKGGRLAQACAPARVVTLAISDVPGDDPSIIGSGPTVSDSTKCFDALGILERYNISIPLGVREGLEEGLYETPKPGALGLDGEVFMIATPQQSLQAAAYQARLVGLNVYILSDEMEGESREVARVHAAIARSVVVYDAPFLKPCVILSGGETTVTIRPQKSGVQLGRGGRAGEFCLSLAQALQGQSGIYALAADTDGIDGVENNAGVFIGPDVLVRATAKGLNVQDFLDRHDAYSFFSALDTLVITGPTYTNVNDFRAILIL